MKIVGQNTNTNSVLIEMSNEEFNCIVKGTNGAGRYNSSDMKNLMGENLPIKNIYTRYKKLLQVLDYKSIQKAKNNLELIARALEPIDLELTEKLQKVISKIETDENGEKE